MQSHVQQKLSKIIIVSGMAGSGKSVALRALEDLGFHCVDNLPALLLPGFIEACANHQFHAPLVALALDSRDRTVPSALLQNWSSLKALSSDVELIFLEAGDNILHRRFRETRRIHPLSNATFSLNDVRAESLAQAISLDAEILEPVRSLATRVVDTSQISSQMLRQMILHDYAPLADHNELSFLLVSFGFKYGTPVDLDTFFDVRCFPNPHYFPELRPLTGLDDSVAGFVLNDSRVSLFIDKVSDLLNFLIPLYKTEGKRYLAVGIGCTGGKHRSVAIVESLGKRLKPLLPNLRIEHRHFDRE